MSRYEYLILVRHGRVDNLDAVRAVARRLAETISDLSRSDTPLRITAVEHARTTATCLTAQIFAQTLEVQAQESKVALGPELFPASNPKRAAGKLIGARCHISARMKDEDGLLIVGHEPAIDWLLNEWVDWGNQPLALAPAELVCLARCRDDQHDPQLEERAASLPRWRWRARKKAIRRWHLWWVITPSEEAAIDPLRQKVASKMTVLSVLSGFTLAVTGASLIDLAEDTIPRALGGAAAACFALAATAYVCVLLAYDELLMPHRFWHAGRPRKPSKSPVTGKARRPPSSAGIVIYQHMVALWRWVVRSIWLSGLGVTLLALAEVWPDGALAHAVVGGVAAVIALTSLVWWAVHRPRFGPED